MHLYSLGSAWLWLGVHTCGGSTRVKDKKVQIMNQKRTENKPHRIIKSAVREISGNGKSIIYAVG